MFGMERRGLVFGTEPLLPATCACPMDTFSSLRWNPLVLSRLAQKATVTLVTLSCDLGHHWLFSVDLRTHAQLHSAH
jgi:hypothetical protein